MMRNPRQTDKVGLIIIFLSIFLVYLIINTQSPTNYARNTFFYADYFVAEHIFSYGEIPVRNEIELSNEWGKIGTLTKTPILPLFISTFKIITGISTSTIYTSFPSFLVLASGLFIIMHRMKIPILSAILLSITGGIAIPSTAFYPIAASATSLGILFLGISLVLIHIQNNLDNGNLSKISTGVPIIIFLVYLFYRYPPNFAILSLIIVSAGGLQLVRRKRMPMYLSLVVCILFIGLQIIEIPLTPYVNSISNVILNIIHLDFANPATAYSSSPAGTYQPRYYSLIPIPVLLPMAIVGGVYTLLDLRKSNKTPSTVAVAWGITAFIISIVYMVTSVGWLTARAFFFALPVIILGAGRFLKEDFISSKTLMSSLILILVLISIALQLTLPTVAIHTYEPGVKSGSQWAGEHVEGPVISDHKAGAPMAASGNFNAVYPRDEEYERVQQIFYTENYSVFAQSSDSPVLLTKGMTRYGFRAAKSLNKPMTEESYSIRVQNSNRVYSNGETTLVIPQQ